ncbi:MAG: putative quinol monooxygenase [Pseudomonadales bacterium]
MSTTIVAGTIEISAENRDRALSEAAQLMVDTRSQAGCNHYVWAADPGSDTRIYVYEEWASTEALASHLAGEYYSGMLGHLSNFDLQNVEVKKYQVAREQAVYDSQGVARADFFDE